MARIVLGVLVALVLALGGNGLVGAQTQANGETVALGASDNVGAALAWSGLLPDGSVTEALLARDDVFADALASGGPQYGHTADGESITRPLLLTAPRALDDRVLAELRRLGVVTVYILGGPNAVTEAVRDELEDNGFTVEPVWDNGTRVETAAAIALRFPSPNHHYVLARAFGDESDPTRAFADSLAAGTAGGPVLLTETAQLSESTRRFLQNNGAETVTIAGGTGAVSAAVEQELIDMGLSVARRSGPSRFVTAAQLGVYRFANLRGVGAIWIDGGAANAWAAGLPAVAHAQRDRMLILLTAGETVPSVTADLTWAAAQENRLLCAPFLPTAACALGDAAAHVSTDANVASLHADLDGASEVPGPGHPSAQGDAQVHQVVDEAGAGTGQRSFCYRYTVLEGDLGPLSGAHIHRGEAGQSGPVVFGLTTDTTPLLAGSPPHAAGCVITDAGTVDELFAQPQSHYVNLHTPAYPDGAIRGQLIAVLA